MKRIDYAFTRMPAQWIRDGKLTLFQGGSMLGTSVTALKLYIAILSEIRSDDNGPGFGRARLTFSDLEERTGAARAMIAPALEFLRPWVSTTRSRSGNVYEIVDFTTKPGAWVRLPAEYIRTSRALHAFPSRSSVSLSAMKMYLYLLERCERRSTFAKASYPKIREIAGVLQNNIPRAIVALGAADLIRASTARRAGDTDSHGHNVYYLLGLGPKVANNTELDNSAFAVAGVPDEMSQGEWL
ncbi:hypothetical protein [Longimicrobium sp.]|uniref:hypothetical protein n=1 Tax=Longimicrobium sp. TaxID=2029185 RepID=UPI002E340B8A|nr:hypothetical protein [Longimicrobium sp.]HEX6039508.1 hypothetical protein [Longimicrobium sp.]